MGTGVRGTLDKNYAGDAGYVERGAIQISREMTDRVRIGLNPLVLGGGAPMFKPSGERMRLKLLEARPMQSGVVLLRYARV